jgi:ATP-dependent 26S proteasome regulatory subunit
MEALLIEMRHEQDVKLKRIGALERQIGELTEYVRASASRRPSTRRKT